MAPLVIGIFLLGSVQLVFMGMLGDYIGAIHTQVQHGLWQWSSSRINFQFEPGLPKSTHSAPAGATAAWPQERTWLDLAWLRPIGNLVSDGGLIGCGPPRPREEQLAWNARVFSSRASSLYGVKKSLYQPLFGRRRPCGH